MDFLPEAHFTASTSNALLVIIALIQVAGFLVGRIMARVNAGRARLANAALKEDAKLFEGQRVIAGLVEHARDSDVAVRVEIDQEGSEWENSGSWSHRWMEVDRRTHVAPFYVRTKSGERVRVEVTREVYLIDDLDGVILVRRDQRTRVAELVPGEHVIVVGALHRDHDPESRDTAGYRDVAVGWVIRAPKRGRLQLSTRPLGERLERVAKQWRSASVAVLVTSALIALACSPYLARLTADEAQATVANKRYHTSESDGSTVHHYDVRLERVGDSAVFTQDVGAGVYAMVDVGDVVSVRIPRVRWLSSIGKSATLNYVGGGFSIFFTLIALIMLLAAPTLTRWFEGKQNDSGSGKLPPAA